MDLMSILKNLYGGAQSDVPSLTDHAPPGNMPMDGSSRGGKGSDIGAAPPMLGDDDDDQQAGGKPLAGILSAVGQMAGQNKQQPVAAQPLTPMSGIYAKPQPIPYDPSQYQPMRRY